MLSKQEFLTDREWWQYINKTIVLLFEKTPTVKDAHLNEDTLDGHLLFSLFVKRLNGGDILAK